MARKAKKQRVTLKMLRSEIADAKRYLEELTDELDNYGSLREIRQDEAHRNGPDWCLLPSAGSACKTAFKYAKVLGLW